jgi:hypothetical protein
MNIQEIQNIKTLNELEVYEKTIKEAIENRKEFISLCEAADNASKKSFGFIKEAFETISPELFNSKSGKQVISKYVNTIKESKNLSNLHVLYENLRKTGKDTDMDFFINNIANTSWGINHKTLNEDILKLGRVLSEGILTVGSKSLATLPTENTKFDNAVRYIAEHKRTNNNISAYSDAVKVIREHVSSNESVKNIFENIDIDTYVNHMIESFNRKYSDLSNEEKQLIKEFNNCSNKEDVFNRYKNECIQKLSEAKAECDNNADKTSSNRINAVLEKVTNKQFVLENAGTDICGFMDLTKLFE